MRRPVLSMGITTLLLLAILAFACSRSSRSLTIVTGKVVYKTLAMEGAEIKVEKMESGSSFAEAMEDRKWKVVEESRSGYHGAFRLHLAAGTYRIEGRTTIRSGDNAIILSGTLDDLTVDRERVRIDRILVELREDQL